VLVLPFTRDLSMMPPFEFAEEILSTALHAAEIHEGFNFHFGHKKEGNVERLKEFGKKLGFDVIIYQAMNLFGALAVLVSLIGKFNLPVFVLESAWSVISAYGIWQSAQRRKRMEAQHRKAPPAG